MPERMRVDEVLDDLPIALRFVRVVRGLSLRDASLASGVTHNVFSRIERGIASPTLVTTQKLIAWIATGESQHNG